MSRSGLRPRSMHGATDASFASAAPPPDSAQRVNGARARNAGPGVVAQREATFSMRFAQRLIELAERAGVQRAGLTAAAGIDGERLDAPEARLPRSQLLRLFELALERTGDPALGLHCTERLNASGFAPVSHLVAHAPNLREAFASLASFERLLTDRPSAQLLEQGDKVTLRCPSPPDASPLAKRFSAETRVTAFFSMLRFFAPRARPERVCFDYEAPPYQSEYARIFEGLATFSQAFTGLVFDRALLDLPSPHGDAGVHAALRELAERRMVGLAQHAPYVLRVRDVLVEQGDPRRVDMSAVARSLGLSTRSLRRRLAAEGRSYKSVENDALAVVAKRLLRDRQRTIQEIAHAMGFSDTTSFHRAFKRWTGTTPGAYREVE